MEAWPGPGGPLPTSPRLRPWPVTAGPIPAMTEFVLANEAPIRLGFFGAILIAVALAEFAMPRRARAFSRWRRWPSNFGLMIVNTVVLRFVFPTAAVGMAAFAAAHGWGLLNVVALPGSVTLVASLLALDFIIYFQHVLFHAVPVLWRLHRMHHTDLDFDVTTGTRFHPVEILLSMVIKLGAIAALGAPVVAVIVFEVVLNGTAMFNHGNFRIPVAFDRVLRWFVVTPDMHRVHHSIVVRETNSNFGFNVPWWDRLLGTYRSQPEAGHEAMTIGIEQFREPRDLDLDRLLVQPLRGGPGPYAINRPQAGP